MALATLGKFIEQSEARNIDGLFGEDAVVGLSTQKEVIHTKADLSGVNLSSYKLFPPRFFAFVPDTSRRGDKMSMAYNMTSETFLVSSISCVFFVKETERLNPMYLYMYFNRPEFDRYSRFNSWGSARETFSWEEMCDMEIDLPPLEIQQKYAAIFLAMLDNQRCYERGLDDLRLTCDAFIENLRRQAPCRKIGDYLIESDRRNDIGLAIDSVRGLATSKEIIPTKADMDGVSFSNYKQVLPRQIAYVPDTSRRGDKVSLGFNNTEETYLVSSISIVFGTDMERLLPEYLMLFLTRSEFDRYARFHSWGSARETFNFDDMCEVEIPVPEIRVQKAISDIFTTYTKRREANERLRAHIKGICPILIKGSVEEALCQ